MNLTITGPGAKTCINPADTTAGIACVTAGGKFFVNNVITGIPVGGYLTVQSYIVHSPLVYKGNNGLLDVVIAAATNDCSSIAVDNGKPPAPAGTISVSCTDGTLTVPTVETFKGTFVSHSLTCTATASLTTITSEPLAGPVAGGNGSGFVAADGVTQVPTSDSQQVRCQVPPPSATPTVTNTATNTPTRTPTQTQVSQPPFVKSPSTQNLWLTRQGTKIPPVQCIASPISASADKAVFQMNLGVPIAALDPKGSGKIAEFGAFEFEVNYDANKVCVDINVGQAAVTMTCTIQDSVSKPILEGVARIGCVTVGKKVNVDGIWNFNLSALGGALTANCVIGIQEAPLGLLASGIFPVKGAMIATGPGALSGANCTGSTPAFGWIVPGGGPLAGKCQVTGPLAPCLFNNQTGSLVALIPCVPPNLGPLCQANGSVSGTFFQEPTTREMAFSGTFTINGGTLFNKLVINGTITGARKSRFALNLASVTVYPQPDLYSQGRANQNNGNVVQLANKKCELATDQGRPIPHFSCNDAEVTIRYLEGDVEPDCRITSADTQAIAFRWGSRKGTLIYNDRFNLEPGGTQADNDIDIKDLQFVYGRFGSTCAVPHPPQPPVNAKA